MDSYGFITIHRMKLRQDLWKSQARQSCAMQQASEEARSGTERGSHLAVGTGEAMKISNCEVSQAVEVDWCNGHIRSHIPMAPCRA